MKFGITFLLSFFFLTFSKANEIRVGAAEVDITPELPVALMGQFHLRIATEAETPLKANVILLESYQQGQAVDTVVFVSCDLVYIPNQVWQKVRTQVANALPGFNPDKIILSATHTHTAPVLEDESDKPSFIYKLPQEKVLSVADYRSYLVGQISQGIVTAWENRSPGKVTWGLRRAAIPYNRRVVYKDGTAVMYGATNKPEFENIEGYEDHDVHSVFFWNNQDQLIAMSVDVACPAQEVEGNSTVDADYWHPVRNQLKEKYGQNLVVAGWIGAAGDQSPHPIYRKKALERMRNLSKVTRMEDIAQRIVEAVDRTLDIVSDTKSSAVELKHTKKVLQLPMRKITVQEYVDSKRISKAAADEIEADASKADQLNTKMTWFGDIVRRYEMQKSQPNPQYETEVHVIRLGDIVICTNQFELFTDFGLQMQARSPALQTLVVQLAGPGTYLATDKAVKGGGYSAVCQSNAVSPEGGKILVEETLTLIEDLWKE